MKNLVSKTSLNLMVLFSLLFAFTSVSAQEEGDSIIERLKLLAAHGINISSMQSQTIPQDSIDSIFARQFNPRAAIVDTIFENEKPVSIIQKKCSTTIDTLGYGHLFEDGGQIIRRVEKTYTIITEEVLIENLPIEINSYNAASAFRDGSFTYYDFSNKEYISSIWPLKVQKEGIATTTIYNPETKNFSVSIATKFSEKNDAHKYSFGFLFFLALIYFAIQMFLIASSFNKLIFFLRNQIGLFVVFNFVLFFIWREDIEGLLFYLSILNGCLFIGWLFIFGEAELNPNSQEKLYNLIPWLSLGAVILLGIFGVPVSHPIELPTSQAIIPSVVLGIMLLASTLYVVLRQNKIFKS